MCSVGRGFQAADSPVCYMLICCKNLKSLGGSSSILLGCPVHVSVQADAQRPLVPEYGGFLSSSSTSPHYFISSHQPSRTCKHAHPPPRANKSSSCCFCSGVTCVPSPPPQTCKGFPVCESRESHSSSPGRCLGDAWERRHCRKSASFFLSILVAVYF